jgi:hypothetical protein
MAGPILAFHGGLSAGEGGRPSLEGCIVHRHHPGFDCYQNYSQHTLIILRRAGFTKPLMAKQRRHASCVGDGGNRTHRILAQGQLTGPNLPYLRIGACLVLGVLWAARKAGAPGARRLRLPSPLRQPWRHDIAPCCSHDRPPCANKPTASPLQTMPPTPACGPASPSTPSRPALPALWGVGGGFSAASARIGGVRWGACIPEALEVSGSLQALPPPTPPNPACRVHGGRHRQP